MHSLRKLLFFTKYSESVKKKKKKSSSSSSLKKKYVLEYLKQAHFYWRHTTLRHLLGFNLMLPFSVTVHFREPHLTFIWPLDTLHVCKIRITTKIKTQITARIAKTDCTQITNEIKYFSAETFFGEHQDEKQHSQWDDCTS